MIAQNKIQNSSAMQFSGFVMFKDEILPHEDDYGQCLLLLHCLVAPRGHRKQK